MASRIFGGSPAGSVCAFMWTEALSGRDRDAGAVPRRGRDRDELAVQVVRRAGGDAHVGERAGADRCGRREVHELVLAGAPGEHAGVALAWAFDDDLLDAPDTGGVLAPGGALDDRPQLLGP